MVAHSNAVGDQQTLYNTRVCGGLPTSFGRALLRVHLSVGNLRQGSSEKRGETSVHARVVRRLCDRRQRWSVRPEAGLPPIVRLTPSGDQTTPVGPASAAVSDVHAAFTGACNSRAGGSIRCSLIHRGCVPACIAYS